MKYRAHVCAVLTAMLGNAAMAADVAVTYSLLPESDDGTMSRGRVVLQLANLSGQSLDDVSVRAALPMGGQLSGAVLDAVDLAPGGIVVLNGEYVMGQELSLPGNEVAWHVTYRGADGQPQPASAAIVRQD